MSVAKIWDPTTAAWVAVAGATPGAHYGPNPPANPLLQPLWVDSDEDPPVEPEARHYIGAAGEPAFVNAWVNFEAGGPPPTTQTTLAYFYKDRSRVYLAGIVKGGASGAVMFTLPVGYRSGETLDFVVLGGPSASAAFLTVTPTGDVKATAIAGSNVTAFVELNGVSFRV